MKVFLGGTCHGTDWRDYLISRLTCNYFNPVVDDWNEEAIQREFKEREECDYLLYWITPKIQGVASIAEVIDDCHRRKGCVVFGYGYTPDGVFEAKMLRSLSHVGRLVRNSGNFAFDTLDAVAAYLNSNETHTLPEHPRSH